jgi:hypothetical protein
MGTVTAFYALGAALAPFLFNAGLGRIGEAGTMLITAGLFMALGLGAAALLHRAGLAFEFGGSAPLTRSVSPPHPRAQLPGCGSDSVQVPWPG